MQAHPAARLSCIVVLAEQEDLAWQIAPFLDTIPGRTTAALLPVLQRTGLHMSVAIAERDAATKLTYNRAVLLGPNGVIGKYRMNGLDPQDQKVLMPGTTGVEVFDTPVGRIALLICYDDSYWQYARLAALRGAQIIAWHSVSDRVMPGTPLAEATGNHSTVANVQYMSAQNGVWVVGTTRNGGGHLRPRADCRDADAHGGS